jgi:signal transduction histidine kinase
MSASPISTAPFHQTLREMKILLVDDEPVNIALLEDLLQSTGYFRLCATNDSRRAPALYREFAPDLVLLDLMMPFMNGFEVMQRFRQDRQDNDYVPVLVLTADASVETRHRALAAGATDFLTKPFDAVEAQLRIRNLLFGRWLHLQLASRNESLEEAVRVRTAELEAAKIAAESASRSKSQFLGIMSHELRTPMIGVIGMADVLSYTTLDADQRECVDIIRQSGDAMLRLLDRVLFFSSLESGALTPKNIAFSLRASLEEIIASLRERADAKSLGSTVEIASDIPDALVGDPTRLRGIIECLLDNAFKFTRYGEIILQAEVDHRTSEAIYLRFCVADTGIGIGPEQHEQIFQQFTQGETALTRRYGGIGLGLALASRLVESMSGRIWVESAVAQGSRFYFNARFGIQDTSMMS